MKNVQYHTSYEDDMVLYSNQNYYRTVKIMIEFGTQKDMGSSHNSNNMEKTTLVAHGPNHEHLSRKQVRQLLNKLGDLTMNAEDMMKEYNSMEEQMEEDAAQQTIIKM